MSDKVDARPVSKRRGKAEQQKAHGHVLERAHLEQPAAPVEQSLSAAAVSAKRGRHQVFGDESRRDGEKTEIVAGVNAVPERTHRHRQCYPEQHKPPTNSYC